MSTRARVGHAESRRLTATLPASALSARRAREFVATALRNCGCRDQTMFERMALVTSELVTNAVVHAGTRVELRMTIDRGSVYLEVLDGSAESPKRKPPALSDTSGRGLVLVDALVDAWGVKAIENGPGKLVWVRVNAA